MFGSRQPVDDGGFISMDNGDGFGSVDRSSNLDLIGDAPNESEGAAGEPMAWSYLGSAVSRRRRLLFFGLIFLGLAVVFVRVGQLQVLEGDRYRVLSEGNRLRTEWVPSERGVIYDSRGTELVRNVPQFDLTAVPSDLPPEGEGREEMIVRLADIAGLAPLEVENRLQVASGLSGQPVRIAERLTQEQAVRASIEESANGSVRLAVGTHRAYAATGEFPSLSHVLGYQSRVTEADLADRPARSLLTDMIGRTGLERSYESALRGEYGKRLSEVDAFGRQKAVVSEEPGVSGASLALSLDLEAQKAAETFLREALQSSRASRGSVIVMDPRNGDLIALVSLPGYDANLFAQGISVADYAALSGDPDRPLFNRAIAASLPSGSTFKLAVAAAALEEGTITRRTTIMSAGGISVGQRFFPDWKAGGHGLTDVTKAIAESVNTFFYAIGGGWGGIVGLGVDRIVEYAARFGFGKRTGLDLPGEGSGFLPSREWRAAKGGTWYVGDTYNLSIGQGDLLVTPLQVAAMTAAFANGGHSVVPRLVAALIDGDGARREIAPSVSRKPAVSADSVEAVRIGMRRAVTEGSARSLSFLPFAAAAKTGTAQWNRNRANHAWFTSFAPYDDPEIVVTVVVEEGGEGSATAAPVARKFYEWWAAGRPVFSEYLERQRAEAVRRAAEAAVSAEPSVPDPEGIPAE